MASQTKSRAGDKRTDKNTLERVIFGVSTALVAGIVGYLAFEASTFEPTPPDISVRWVADPGEHEPFRFLVTAQNEGGETAEDVEIELQLRKADEVVERANLKLPFLPRDSKRESWISFSLDPASADTVIARVVSFKRP